MIFSIGVNCLNSKKMKRAFSRNTKKKIFHYINISCLQVSLNQDQGIFVRRGGGKNRLCLVAFLIKKGVMEYPYNSFSGI